MRRITGTVGICLAAVGVLAGLAFGQTTTTSTSTTTTSSLIADPACEKQESSCYHTYEGVRLGDESRGKGCLNWSDADLCFFIDLNCNYVLDAGERTMCDCECDECLPIGATCVMDADCCTGQCINIMGSFECSVMPTTTSTSTSSSTTTSTTVTSTTSTSASVTTTSTSTTTSTTTTTLVETFAEGICYTVIGLRPEHDNLVAWIAPSDNNTIYYVSCHCEGECASSIATLALSDGAGNAITTASTLTCDSGNSTSSFVATNDIPARTLSEGEALLMSVTNSPASYDRVTLCALFTP